MPASPAPARYISSLSRLQELPALFRGSELTMRYQWTAKTASQYLYLWKQKGLVAPLGGGDVYANLVKAPNPNWEEALLMAAPSAKIIGLEVLRRVGWITQIQARPSVAISPLDGAFTSPRFTVERRDARWLLQVRRGKALIAGVGRVKAPQLAPAWALADLLKREGWGGCGIQPDDLYLDDMTDRDRAQWAMAAAAFELPADILADVDAAPEPVSSDSPR